MATVKKPATAKRKTPRQVVFSFDEGGPETQTAAVRGGKGVYLAKMVALGLPVPPGFTVTTTVARAFSETGKLPVRLSGQLTRSLERLERQTGKQFGNPENPLLVSVRSGAQASMPGMMDTVLNVGLNPATVAGLARLYGEQFALDAYCRFLTQFGAVVLNVPVPQLEYVISSTKAKAGEEGGELSIDTLSQTCERLRLAIEFNIMRPVPDNPQEQLELSLNAVMRSWMSERAQAYRQANDLPSWWGTAANVQAMVFGNRSNASGTGVVFSHDVTTGKPGLYGEFLPNAQGEDVVAGTHQPLPISAMADWNLAVYDELKQLVRELVDHLGDIVDVEFTVEEGELFLLQVRRAKRSALAAVTFAVHQVWAGHMNREQAVGSVSSHDVDRLRRAEFDGVQTEVVVILRGLAASPGAAVGRVVLSSAEARIRAALGDKVILVTRDTTPDDLPGMLCAEALVTGNGGATCHAAVVAREQGLPAVVGVGEAHISQLTSGQIVSVDGTTGTVYNGALPFANSVELTKEATIFLRWAQRFDAYQPKLDFALTQRCDDVNLRLNNFYLVEAMAAAASSSSIEARLLRLRDQFRRETAELFATYLVMAVAGEIRHAFDYVSFDCRQEMQGLAQFGVISCFGRSEAQTSVMRHLSGCSRVEQARFFELCATVFASQHWDGSYGGPKWQAIAQVGHDFLSGALSPLLFVDHVFDLRHNGGYMFDKHAMVETLTDEYQLSHQLEIKKFACDTADLYARLKTQECFSDEVTELFREGSAIGLW